jgi:hypothetical protein
MSTKLLLPFLILVFSAATNAQQQDSIPYTVKFTGSLRGLQQSQPNPPPIGVTFAFYEEQTGGAPLWLETQNVVLDLAGRFTVFLGAASATGIPLNVFASGDARWLGITPQDGVERARVMLASVPYAFKAADAQTINGRAPEEFVTQEQLSSYMAALNPVVPVQPIVSGVASSPANPPSLVGAVSGSVSLPGAAPRQPTATQRSVSSKNISNFTNSRALQLGDYWTMSNIPTTLTAGVQAAITLTPCPLGVDTSGNPILGGPNGGYPVYLADTVQPNNSEEAYVTGGDCTSGAASGTIIFIPYFSHAMSTYTIGSASSGIQEAINSSCGTSITSWRNTGCQVVLPPTGVQLAGPSGYDVYATIYFHANGSLLSGYGAILNCHERGPCLQVGDLSSASDYTNNAIQGVSFRSPDNHSSDPAFNGSLIASTQRTGGTITIQTATPHNLRTGDRVTQMLTDLSNYWGDVPSITVSDATHYTYARPGTADIPLQTTPGVVALSYEAVLDNGQSTSLVDLDYANTYENGAFNHFFDFWDDENAQVSNFDNSAIPLNRNANWTGSFVWSGGALALPNVHQQLAPVITVSNSSITANGSNCATIYNSNEFSFQNSVCQAQGPWEFLVSDINGNYQGASFQNIYSEASVALNPSNPVRSPWPGLGVAGFIGGVVSGAGSYTLSGQNGFGGALPVVGSGSRTYVYYVIARDLTAGTQTSPLPFMYEQENSPSLVAVQWPRVAFGTDTIVYDLVRNPAPAGSMSAALGGYVAPYQGGCNGGSNLACGSVAIGLAQCPGFVCSFADNTANTTSPYSVKNGTFVPNPSFFPGAAVLSNTALISNWEVPVTGIAFGGAPTEYADYCSDYGANVSGGYTVCANSPAEPNTSVADQPALILTDGGGGNGGVPGAKGRLIFETASPTPPTFHQIVTLYDSNPAKTQATTGHRPVGDPADMYLGIDANQNLMIGGGLNGIAQYVNNIGSGTPAELLTNSRKLFSVPVQAPNIDIAQLLLNGSQGLPGQVPVATASGVVWGTCGGTASQNALSLPASGDQAQVSAERVVPSNDFLPTAVRQRVLSQISNSSSLSGNASLSFTGLVNGACQAQTFLLEGAHAGEAVIPKWPVAFDAGLLGNMRASADNRIEVRLCNFSGEVLAPAPQIYGALIPRN